MSATATTADFSEMIQRESRYQTIYAVVRRIPAGFVATYGQVAALAGFEGCARQVGYALSALADKAAVPWHRVVNARGGISQRSGSSPGGQIQRLRLEEEGIELDGHGRILLLIFQWQPHPGLSCEETDDSQ
jgi:methylated-DNA-protein-cysteine methyltransferase-like protein